MFECLLVRQKAFEGILWSINEIASFDAVNQHLLASTNSITHLKLKSYSYLIPLHNLRPLMVACANYDFITHLFKSAFKLSKSMYVCSKMKVIKENNGKLC